PFLASTAARVRRHRAAVRDPLPCVRSAREPDGNVISNELANNRRSARTCGTGNKSYSLFGHLLLPTPSACSPFSKRSGYVIPRGKKPRSASSMSVIQVVLNELADTLLSHLPLYQPHTPSLTLVRTTATVASSGRFVSRPCPRTECPSS